jgi:hypothetical protein
MSDKYYIIKSNLNFNNKKYDKYYYVNISFSKKEDNILVGGLNIKCVHIIINKRKNIGLLELVQHHEKCSFFETLKDGNETVDLVKNSLFFAANLYPDVSKFELIDNSFITCKNGKRISLADLHFVKYGKTWYENKFGAILTNQKKNTVNLTKSGILKNLNSKIEIPLEDFITEYHNEDFFDNQKNINIIKKIYNSNITLKEYLNYFFKNKYDCRYYQYIFSKFIGTPLQGLEWIIEKNTIKNYGMIPIIIETEKITKHTDLKLLHNKLKKIKKKEDKKNGGGIFNNGYC